MSVIPPMLVDFPEKIEAVNGKTAEKRADILRRFPIAGSVNAPLRISAEVRTEGVTGTPGIDCSIFFNLEYDDGPIFWDTFLYPDTGTMPWRTLSCEVRARGVLRAVELHVRLQRKGKLSVRHLRVETIEPWGDDADVTVALFGDSTDMTSYLPTEHRLARRLELLLRDRFADHRVDVHCFAEGGETIQRLVEDGHLEQELRALTRCDVAMLRYGLNDRGKSDPPLFGRQLHTACDMILGRFPKAKIVLSTTIPPHAAAYDEQTLAVARERGLPVIRVDELMRQRSAAGDWDWHDGPRSRIGRRRTQSPPDDPTGLKGDLHPNAYGSQMIAELYFENIEQIVAEVLGRRTPARHS